MHLSSKVRVNCRDALKVMVIGFFAFLLFGLATAPTTRAQQTKGASTGYIEICKDQEPGVWGDFHFTVDSQPGDHVVAPGTCTPPISVTPGTVRITETGIPDDVILIGASTNPTSALDGVDPAHGTVDVNVPQGDQSAEVVLYVKNVPAGWIEWCKYADQWITGTVTVTYTSRDYPVVQGSVDVPVGACTAPMKVPAGGLDAVEQQQPGTILKRVTAGPPGDGSDLLYHTDGSFSVHVPQGDASREVQVNLWDDTLASLKVCKIYGHGVEENTPFWFDIYYGGQRWSETIPAGPASSGGFCKLIPLPTDPLAGDVVRIVEEPPALHDGQEWFLNVDQDGTPLPPDSGAVNVTLHPGLNVVTFENEIWKPDGLVKVCAAAGDATTAGKSFTFDVSAGLGATASVTVQAGAQAGGYCEIVQLPRGSVFYLDDSVTVTERSVSGTRVTGIDVLPNDVEIQAQNLANRQVVITKGPGLDTVIFTNAASAAAPASAAPPAPAGSTAPTPPPAGSDDNTP